MAYFVTVTFDIKSGDYNDYQRIYEEFKKIGLSRTLVASPGGTITLPTTTTAGEFNGQSASAVRDHVCEQTQQAFIRNRLHGEVFVAAGGDWAWSHRRP
jgi:hypothetical protein